MRTHANQTANQTFFKARGDKTQMLCSEEGPRLKRESSAAVFAVTKIVVSLAYLILFACSTSGPVTTFSKADVIPHVIVELWM